MMKRFCCRMVVGGAALALTGCGEGSGGSRPALNVDATDGGRAVSAPSGPAGSRERASTKPLALVGGEALTWEQVAPMLAEAAGGGVMEEVVLDRQLAREAARDGITVTGEDARREETLITESTARSSGVSAAEAGPLVMQVRRTRGLGEVRFAQLLRRNAILRRLVQGEVTIGAEDLDQAYAVKYGDKYRVRLIVTATERDAGAAVSRVAAGEAFGEVAAAVSIDPSKFRGGMLEPLSTSDPTYPSAIRRAVSGLEPGGVSAVLAIEDGFAIVKLEERLPGRGGGMSGARGELEREVRLVRERVLMDRLARRLVAQDRVTVFDPSLNWSWENRAVR